MPKCNASVFRFSGQLLPVASDRFRAGQIGGQIAN